ncbi:MAG: phosphoenolpyruvate--protein phosphotransferase [Treponema sp.]|jgi:phosphotransferase system enzyme I (PtsI)|nr:phosphoenolpyruvate--protein phosphotransferase [Treponema sp.]
MKTFSGIPASAGLAMGEALVYVEDEISEIPHYSIKEGEIPAEWERLKSGISAAALEVMALYERAGRETSKEQAAIFQAHLFMLEDEDFHDQLKARLKESLSNAEWVIRDVSREIGGKLSLSPDPLFRERAIDIADVSRRLIKCLMGIAHGPSSLAELDKDVILVAHDLMPSDTLVMNKSRVKGIALDEGSKTCHTAILARAFNIPAVLGLSDISKKVQDGEMLALNGSAGTVIANPDKKTLDLQKKEESLHRKQIDELSAMKEFPAETSDGHRVTLKANIGLPEEAEGALHHGAEGIGLFRSEFLFLTPGKDSGEETQYLAYSLVLKTMGKLPVTIRTMDLGGDKFIPGQNIGEKNPLLGCRAIRLSLANPKLFKEQLRAILRAGVHGNARIMFPMISGIEELEQSLALFDEARAECKKKGQPFAEEIETGVMIEIPSAAMTADILAEKARFFSLGTNDLVQYSLAVDRGNEKVNYLSETYHPAVLRFIKRAIDAAHEKGIKAAMCGEFAGDPSATPLLLGLGLDEFSMAASSIPQIKKIIRGRSLDECKKIADNALKGRSIAEVLAAVNA